MKQMHMYTILVLLLLLLLLVPSSIFTSTFTSISTLTRRGMLQYGGSGKTVQIDSLLYDTHEHNPDIKNRAIKTFTLPLPLETFPAPRRNHALVKELRYLHSLVSSTNKSAEHRRHQRDAIRLGLQIEKGGLVKYFVDYAGKNGLMYSEEHLKQVYKDTITLAYLLKSYYNRPRPYQLGFLLGYNIVPAVMADTSSYPCEYTLAARVLADQLIYNNPEKEHTDQLNHMAKRVELSRYYTGLNFPSDTVASLKLAGILKDHIRYLDGGT